MSGQSEGYDPVIEYVVLGDDISDGVFGWIALGMDSGAAYNISAAARWTENGGVAEAGAGGPPGGGAGGPPPDASGANGTTEFASASPEAPISTSGGSC